MDNQGGFKVYVITPEGKNIEHYKGDGFNEWNFSCNKLEDLCLTAGQYGVFERDVRGTDVEFFYPLAAYREFESRGNDTLDIFTFFSEKFGEDYAENLLLRKWQEQTDELNRNFYRRNPEYMNKLSMLSKYNVSLFLRGGKIYGLGPLTVYKMYNQIGEDNYYNFMRVIYDKYYYKYYYK